MANRPAPSNVVHFPKTKVAPPEDYREPGSWRVVSICLVSILFFAMCFAIDVLTIPPRTDCNLSVRGACSVNSAAENASLAATSSEAGSRGLSIQQ
jgi:hypothetical protein